MSLARDARTASGGRTSSAGAARRRLGVGPILVAIALIAACEPTTPPSGVGTGPPSSASPSGPPAGTSILTVTGDTIQIVGTSNLTTDEFDLTAGSADMTVSTCPSSQVIPFVTIYDGKDNKLGLIVDSLYTIKNLAGGKYYLMVAADPSCVWTITLKPV